MNTAAPRGALSPGKRRLYRIGRGSQNAVAPMPV